MVKKKVSIDNEEDGTVDEKGPIDPYLAEIGRRIKKLRTDAGVSQRALGDAAGVSSAYIYLIEVGRQNVTVTVFRRIAEALKTPIGDLLGEDELREPTEQSMAQLSRSVERLSEAMAVRREQDNDLFKEMERLRAVHLKLLDYFETRREMDGSSEQSGGRGDPRG